MEYKKSPELMDIAFSDTLNEYLESLFAKNEFSERTKLNYTTYLKKMNLFIKDSLLSEVDPQYIDRLMIWLRKSVDMTYTARCVEICKNAIDHAVLSGKLNANPISFIKPKRTKQKDVVHLEHNELQKFLYPQFNDKEREIARDLYLFQCHTGMSFGDLQTFRVIKDNIGEWIVNQRCKTNTKYWIPMNDEIKRLLEKYSYSMPKINLVTYNRKLKEVAGIEGINKNLSSHTARKTFATLKYDQGWSVESIADMMGITIQVLTKYYIKRSRKRLEAEILSRAKETTTKVIELQIAN